MCDIDKMLKVAEDFFKDDGAAVSKGTKHRQSSELTILIAGRVEFNSYKHRRDAFDIQIKYDLYVKKLADGRYQAGNHDESDDTCFISERPTSALTEMAYHIVTTR